MSKPVDRDGHDASSLARIVPHLPAETLHQLIQYRGLETSTDLLASATPEQVAGVLDLELWRGATPVADEQFDAGRFEEWLEALVHTDDDLAARVIAKMEPRLVSAGLSGCIRVFDPAACPVILTDDDNVSGEGSGSPDSMTCEIGGYLIRARRPDAWDAVVSLLVVLADHHADVFRDVMRGCRRLSDSRPESDGLDGLFSAPDQLFHDLAVEREERQSRQGYLSAAEARAFLQAARSPFSEGTASSSSPLHVIAEDYLRTPDEAPDAGAGLQASDRARPTSQHVQEDESIAAVTDMLSGAGLLPERPRALLGQSTDESAGVPRMRALMDHLRTSDEAAFLARSRELALLANTLVAGCSFRSRKLTVPEVSDAVVATCHLALEQWHVPPPASFLADHDLLTVFHAGWRVLHELRADAVVRLLGVLDDLRCIDIGVQEGLDTLRKVLAEQHAAGTPWLALDALEAIAVLDLPAWASLLGVLDECPVLPAALRATLERRAGAVSATAFEFISTARQVADVRIFLDQLPDILLR